MLAAISLALMPVVQDRAPALLNTIWRNPRDTVRVRFDPCGDKVCGTVTWASEKAIADARKGSARPLVGTRIFRDFRAGRPGQWRGRVYVPDIDKTFGGTVTVEGDRLIGKGCLIADIVCKSQPWVRMR